jgi:hypothetical protein
MKSFSKVNIEKATILLFLVFIICNGGSLEVKAQRLSFSYKRNIEKKFNNWHEIILPADIYKHCNTDLSDIRIIGITPDGETIEAPYLLKSWKPRPEYINIEFQGVNQSKRGNTYYYTFIVPSNETINTIQVQSDDRNYDWKIKLEGSNDGQTWFEFLKNYRVLSIQDDNIKYRHRTIHFETVQYKYIRMSFKSSFKPGKLQISMAKAVVDSGEYYQYYPIDFENSTDDNGKTSEFIFSLPDYVPVSYFKPAVETTNDYYRKYDLECAVDSFQYDGNKWRYIYRNVSYGTISSLEDNIIQFDNILTKKIKLRIKNYDNAPLKINNAVVQGNVHKVIARFDKDADYSIYYGNEEITPPKYDIVAFEHKIPTNLKNLNLGREELLDQNKIVITANKDKIVYVWISLIIVIIVLGIATIHMIKNYQNTT